MSSRKLVNIIVALTMLTSLIAGSTLSATAMPASPVDESKVPHYFGPFPNWANSPYTLADAIVTITGNGSGAEAVATVGAGGAIMAITVTNPGTGYTAAKVDITGSGTGAMASANIIRKGSVVSISLASGGNGYTAPVVTITGNGTGAAATAYGGVDQITLLDGGFGYTFPTVDFDLPDAPDGVQAQGHAVDNDLDGIIDAVILDSPGSGYSTAPGITIRDGTLFDPVPNGGTGAMATTSLSLSSVVMDSFGGNYVRADVSITDPTGTGALATANLDNGIIASIDVTKPGSGYVTAGGIRKFVDGLPGLGPTGANNLGQYMPVAVPDTTTFPDTDYYVIAVVQHREKMHSDLPPTLVREYVQLSTNVVPGAQVPLQTALLDGTTVPTMMPDGITQAVGVDAPHFLGPVIVAQKDRAVRIVFYNLLPTGAAGDLFLPADSTIMGSGMGPMDMMAPMDEGTVMDGVRNQACSEYPKPMDCFKDNRATLHLHGGITPWISDGTPHQWITPADEMTPWPQGVSVMNVPDMENKPGVPDCSLPGDGCQSFYYTNQQSARLMFYHDHSWGITRLNVYAGEAAGYMITDPVEQALINKGILPADQIPLVIQDRTFVPDAAQLAAQDPTWDVSRWGGYGNLWYHHVYMPAQNPGDPGGMSAYGRWMYGPWFWPPAKDALYPPIPNPYYDPNCDLNNPATWQYQVDPFCEPPLMPGTPNISAGMEQFNDTPLVNGTAYPTTTLEPKSYRLRILNAANDRFWNLQWYVADATGTEVALKASEVAAAQTDPVVFPTPDTTLSPVGPSWIQIGTEGGFLPAPVVVPNQPITWITDPTRFDVGNVDLHSLLLAPAERADVIVDFSKYAGKTLILYNDAPAAFPARVPTYDYYTGAPDLSPAGAPSILPGYGPNTRTIMQVKIANSAPAPAFNLSALIAAFKHKADGSGVFESGQHPIIVGQAAYNSAYGTSFAPGGWCNSPTSTIKCDGFARISQQGGDPFTFDTLIGATTKTWSKLSIPLEPKAIHDEMNSSSFDEFGRMTANLGLEAVPATPGLQNVMLYPYTSSPTEIIDGTNLPKADVKVTPIAAADGSQIWKITHNGVDTHPIHFHLYDVQVLNRVTWDNIIIPPDASELGWKDTVRISPLEDTIVALRPIIPVLPFDLPNSVHAISPMMPLGAELSPGLLADPQGNPVRVFNNLVNFGWEYVYHCHILSHEEMDMMRPVLLALPPVAPSFTDLTGGVLTWVDNSLSETSFIVEKSTDAGSTWSQVFQIDRVLGDPNTTGEVLTFVDGSWADMGEVYRVAALNAVGDFAVPGFPTVTAKSVYAYLGNTVPPAAPTSLTAALQTGPQISLTWNDNAVNETGFVIERSEANGPFALLTPVAPLTGTGTVNYIDVSVLPGSLYSYRVAATNIAGQSAFSNIASRSVPAVPAAPVLSAVLQPGPQISLSWTDTNETSFVLEKSLDGVNFSLLATLPANMLSYVDTAATVGDTYSYRVQALNQSGTATSNVVNVPVISLAPAAPTNLTAALEAGPQVSLTWTDNATNETSYIVEQSTDGVNFAVLATLGVDAVSYVDASVIAGNIYSYRVAAVNGSGQSTYSNTASVSVNTPAAPSGLTAALQAGPQVGLTWTDNATDETGFNIEVSTDGVNFSALASVGANVTSYTDAAATVGNIYSYRVAAVNFAGASAFSNTASVSVTPPAAPSNLAAVQAGPQVNLTWTDNAADETGFNIERSTDGVTFSFLASVGANVTSYADTVVTAGVTYTYQVAAVNFAGASVFSNTASVTVIPPAAPSNLAAAQAGAQVDLTWTDNSADETSFNIERSTDGVTFSLLASVGANVTSYADIAVAAGQTYTYQVAAVNSTGASAFSNTASVTMPLILPPAAPTGLTAGNPTTTSLTLRWTDNAVDETGYTVEWSLDGVTWNSINLPANTVIYQVTGLTLNTTYMFRVRAYNLGGPSAYSNEATSKTKRK